MKKHLHVSIFFLILCFITTATVYAQNAKINESFSLNGNKLELNLPEIVITATTPDLIGGKKERISVMDERSSLSLVSESVQKSPLNYPEIIDVLDAPELESPGGGLTPCLGAFGSIGGVKGRMRAAAKALHKGNCNRVVELLTPIALDHPDHPDAPTALYFIAACKRALANLSGAANAYDRLRREYSNHYLAEHASYSLGWIYLQSQNIPRATEMVDYFTDNYPNSPLMPYARYLKSAVLYSKHEYKDALTVLEEIVNGYPFFPYLSQVQFWMAENYYFTGLLEKASSNYSLYIDNFSSGVHVADALYGRAFCHLDTGDVELALQDLKRLLDEFPGYTAASDAAFQAGKIYVTLGDSSSAIPMFKRVLNQSDQAQYRLDEAQAWIAHENGNYFKAAQLFAHAVQNAPPEYDTNTSKFMEALNLSHAEMYQDAVKIFIKIAESSDQPIAYSAYANAGIAEIAMGNLNHANIYLMKALESRKPLRGETIYRLYAAEVLYRLEHFTESLEMFDSLNKLDLAPSLKSEVNRGIAWNYYSAKQWENAALKFGQYASIYSDSPFRPEALLRQAESYFNAGHYQRAADQFECLINEYPLHPEAFEARLLQARIHWVNEEYEMVRNQLNNALRHAKTSEERQRARMMFGDLEQDLKNYQAASEFFRLAYQDDRRSSEAAHALLKQADNLYNNREFNRAKSVYRQITENFPEAEEAATAQYSIGLIYFQQNRLDDYIDEAYGTARDHPGTVQSALALSGAAELLIDQKRFEDAESILKKLLDQYRDHIDPQQLLFRMAEISHQTGHQDRAISLYNQLLNSYPHGLYTADALFALSEHAHRENRIDDSVSYLQQIIDTFPGHPRLADALKLAGDFARDDNRMDDALNYYTRYLELFPDGKNIFAVSLAIASIHVTHKKCDEARKVLQIAKKSKDRTISSQALFFDARCDAIDGDLDEALKQMLKISYLFSDQRKLVIESLVEAGKILNRQNKLDEMERMFKKAADLAQTDKEQQLVREARKAANQAGGDE